MIKVMLIGDSIRLNYQPNVQKELEGEFDVWGIEENCRFAKYTLNELGRMLAAFSKRETRKYAAEFLQPTSSFAEKIEYPDIIHWNNGLWDTSIVCEEDGAFTPIDEYISYIAKILRELRKITNKIIFATTTPVKPQNPNQKNEIITQYNERVVEFMKQKGVVVNDLNKLLSSNLDKYLSEDNIHLSEEGKRVCAKQVAEYIRGI